MSRGIKNEVAIIGMGCTRFGELERESWTRLAAKSIQEALEDAGVEIKDIGACWLNTISNEKPSEKCELSLYNAIGLSTDLVTKTDNFNNEKRDAFHSACYAVASGMCDIALAIGVEKYKKGWSDRSKNPLNTYSTHSSLLSVNANVLSQFAEKAKSYFAENGMSVEQGKRALARISFKNHRNGALNFRACFRHEMRIEEIMNAPIVKWPLGLLDCCQVSNGAASAIVCRANNSKQHKNDPIYIRAIEVATAKRKDLLPLNWHGSHLESTNKAAIKAYNEAGISNPREQINMLETHDCCSMAELLNCEDLLLSPYGKVVEDMDAGFYDLDGKIPCQPDGGYRCFGDCSGASEIRMIYEIYKQLQGKVGNKRQIVNPKYGLTHQFGGNPYMSAARVTIFSN